jgi:hypothetical protein
MNGGNCQNCANSPWVQEANRFISNNRTNTTHRAHVITIEFLLKNGHCGINNRTSIYAITQHLEQNHINMSREAFQNQVLVRLKQEGIVATLVYPGAQGGVFIPCDQNDLTTVATQLISRVTQELANLESIARHTRFRRMITPLRRSAESVRRRI